MRCNNCIDEVYMTEIDDGFYRCPVCGDEYDPMTAGFHEWWDDDGYDGGDDYDLEDDDYVYPEWS